MIGTLGVLAGLLLLFTVLQDAFEVMLLPRRVQRRLRLVRFYFRGSWRVWSALARHLPHRAARERALSVYGPFAMVVLFVLWAAGLVLGFALVEWSLQDGTDPQRSGFLSQLYLSGATFFTVGYGDIAPHAPLARAAAVIEAGTGLGFIAVVIGYLPVLYQLFSRREAHVIQLDGRAGSPPTAGGMLMRHAGALPALDLLLREWEVWGSELLESQLSYPMLAYYRSQHDDQSWLSALACVMDACTLLLVGVEAASALQARMTFGMARQVLVEMGRAFGTPPAPFAGGDRLAPEDYAALVSALRGAGIDWREEEGTRATLEALRATYEPLLASLSTYLLVPVPAWLPPARSEDHWSSGHRGLIAGRLIEELTRASAAAPTGSGRGSARLGWLRRRRRSDR